MFGTPGLPMMRPMATGIASSQPVMQPMAMPQTLQPNPAPMPPQAQPPVVAQPPKMQHGPGPNEQQGGEPLHEHHQRNMQGIMAALQQMRSGGGFGGSGMAAFSNLQHPMGGPGLDALKGLFK